jgi:hypothetical protein
METRTPTTTSHDFAARAVPLPSKLGRYKKIAPLYTSPIYWGGGPRQLAGVVVGVLASFLMSNGSHREYNA